MPTQQNFDGQIIIIPGVYSNIKSGFKNPPSAVAYGNLLIIDTKGGAGGGAGVNGTITKGSDAVYEYDNIADFQSFVEKGFWYLLSNPLFQPFTANGTSVPGVSKITFIKAATTAPATINFTVGADTSDSVGNAGNVKIQVRSEGLVGNGALNTVSELSKGYAIKLSSGVIDPSKFIMNFYRGTFKGLDQNSNPIDGIAEVDSKAELLCQSKEFNTLSVLVDWMEKSLNFNKFFKYDSTTSVIPVHDKVDVGDLHDYLTYKLASGGTESYSSSDLTKALLVAKNLNVDFVFADDYGVDSQSSNNQAIYSWVKDTQKYKPQLYIASGTISSDFDTVSIADTVFYNNQCVTIVHGGTKINSKNGVYSYDSYYTAANLLGREAGLEPQIPLTFKNIGINGLTHVLNDTEQKQALNAGLLVAIPESGAFECLKGVNCLQENDFLLNDNGTTHSKQLFRIAHQLNKEIVITAREELLKAQNGVNRNTLSETDVQQWTKRFLQRKVAEPTKDNIILSFQDVEVTRQSDGYFISYKFAPNTEISFLFFSGLILDVN